MEGNRTQIKHTIPILCLGMKRAVPHAVTCSPSNSDHQQNMLMLQRPERAGSTQEGWEKNSTFRSSLNTPGACQEWLGIVWRVCASSCHNKHMTPPQRRRDNI